MPGSWDNAQYLRKLHTIGCPNVYVRIHGDQRDSGRTEVWGRGNRCRDSNHEGQDNGKALHFRLGNKLLRKLETNNSTWARGAIEVEDEASAEIASGFLYRYIFLPDSIFSHSPRFDIFFLPNYTLAWDERSRRSCGRHVQGPHSLREWSRASQAKAVAEWSPTWLLLRVPLSILILSIFNIHIFFFPWITDNLDPHFLFFFSRVHELFSDWCE